MVQSVSNNKLANGKQQGANVQTNGCTHNSLSSSSFSQHTQHYLRLCVLGASGVGKSAVVVRYLTKRFIGEYRSGVDITYHHIITLQAGSTFIEIWDFSNKLEDDFTPEESETIGDCYLIVFSVADYSSFLAALRTARNLKESDLNSYPQMTLLGNKVDLEHSRQITAEEAKRAAEIIPCEYAEVSAAESREGIVPIINELLLRTIHAQESPYSPPSPNSYYPLPFLLPLKDPNSKSKLSRTTSSIGNGYNLPKNVTIPDKVKFSNKKLTRSVSQRQNTSCGSKLHELMRDKSPNNDRDMESRDILPPVKTGINFPRNLKYRTLESTYKPAPISCASKEENAKKGSFLSNYMSAVSGDSSDRKFVVKKDCTPLSSVFLRGRANTVNGAGKKVKQTLELRPSIDVFQEEKKTTKSRKPNSRFFTLVSSLGSSDSKKDAAVQEAKNKLPDQAFSTCVTRMIIQSNGTDSINSDRSEETINLLATNRNIRSDGMKPKTSDPTHTNAKRKFGVFGITSLGSVFSKGSLPDLPKATASLYTKFGSIKNTIKKRSV